ncbi:hypothetical protein YC2023_038769 [Brassica napus]
MKRGEVATGLNCYMKQHEVTKEEAIEELNKIAVDYYKIIMEEFLTTTAVPRPVLVRCLNVSRPVDLIYKESDKFTNPGELKDAITSLVSVRKDSPRHIYQCKVITSLRFESLDSNISAEFLNWKEATGPLRSLLWKPYFFSRSSILQDFVFQISSHKPSSSIKNLISDSELLKSESN